MIFMSFPVHLLGILTELLFTIIASRSEWSICNAFLWWIIHNYSESEIFETPYIHGNEKSGHFMRVPTLKERMDKIYHL